MEAIDIFEANGLVAKIYQDEEPSSPGEWDQFGEMVLTRRTAREWNFYGSRPTTGTEEDAIDRGGTALLERYYRMTEGAIIQPFELRYDAQGIFSTEPDENSADGFMYASAERIKIEFGEDLEKARACLESEINGDWNTYLTGDVYGYVVEDANGTHLDSCWGFYGYEDVEMEAKAALENCASQRPVVRVWP